MQYDRHGDNIILRIDAGEMVMESIISALTAEGITKGALWAIGAVDMADIGYLDGKKHEVLFKKLECEMEIVSLAGNITLSEGKPFIHAHIALSHADYSMTGGHLREARCSATVEVVILAAAGNTIGRRFNPQLGIGLMDFAE